MLKKGHLNIKDIQYLVIDEADEMLRFGFIEDLEFIFKFSNANKQTLLFSATMPNAIIKLAKNYMTDAKQISITPTLKKTDHITQYFMTITLKSKQDALIRIIDFETYFYGLIFCNTKRQVDDIAMSLINKGYNADALHGDLTQSAREKVLSKFRQKHCTILVVTDVVARGIDIEKLTHVINFSPPQDLESYIHRIGRTGRGGETGKAYTLVAKSESRTFRPIQRHFSEILQKISPPEVKDILLAKKTQLIETLTHSTDKGIESTYTDLVQDILARLSPEDALAAILEHTFKNTFSKDHYRDIRIDSLDHYSKEPFKKSRFSKKRTSRRFNSKKRFYKK